MTKLEAKARELAAEVVAKMDCVVMQDEGDQARTLIADAMTKLAREHAETAVRRYALFRQTSYVDTHEQLILSALRDAEKRIK